MTENEILLKGIVIGVSAIIPFIGIALGKWHHWKAEYMFSKMMHDDAMAQNERLFRAVKSEEDKAKYFESKLKFVIEQYKPIGPINKPTDNNKNNAIELLKPRVMENGCEYYLAGEVRLCIEQAARQIAESNSVYKELERQIEFLKVTHDACGNCNKCAEGMGKVFDKNLNELKAQKAQAEDDCAFWKNLAQKRNLTQPPSMAKENKMEMVETKHDLLTTKYTKVLEEADYKYNAPHTFKVIKAEEETSEEHKGENLVLSEIHFQEGPIKECGVNGVMNEDLLVMVVRRLEGFQNSEFKCRENACAITKIEEALLWLRKRTMGRENRGVEGTHEV